MAIYKGEKAWAPCFHGPDADEKTKEYVKSVLGNDWNACVGTLEDLLWLLGLADYEGQYKDTVEDVKFTFHADQWVGVSCEIHYHDGSVDTLWTEGDSFTATLAKTVERLKAIAWLTPEEYKKKCEEE